MYSLGWKWPNGSIFNKWKDIYFCEQQWTLAMTKPPKKEKEKRSNLRLKPKSALIVESVMKTVNASKDKKVNAWRKGREESTAPNPKATGTKTKISDSWLLCLRTESLSRTNKWGERTKFLNKWRSTSVLVVQNSVGVIIKNMKKNIFPSMQSFNR